eukprot:CAMPEP_0114994628 /NCGR_PEP_ID=MMETSP0216-20121206/13249_1 /TAXON_ID=223996 /ORGANISM="Protocruzia adherens, Strain Boccale" /LENGTH=722 /DNA_ID=CAMNT_0002358519 /DNA_START=25 /DNA_END=2193 /DNA_ORIENTATION=+
MVEFVPRLIKPDELNKEVTAQMQASEDFILYKQWLNNNGVLVNDLEFPAAFGPMGIPGVAAKRTIKSREPLLIVPNKLLITVKKARRSAIRPILLAHPEFFGNEDREDDEGEDDSDYYVLAMFLYFEKMQGKKSFWYPYLRAASSDPSLAEWTESQLDELQDLTLKNEAKANRKALHTIWIAVCRIMAMHRDVFDLSKYTEKEWYWCYNFVVSRAFGWGLPCTMLIPFADALNHSTVNISYDLYAEEADKKLHSKKQISAQGIENDASLGVSPTLTIEKSHLHPFEVPTSSKTKTTSSMKSKSATTSTSKTSSASKQSSSSIKTKSTTTKTLKKKPSINDERSQTDGNDKKMVVDLNQHDIWQYNFGSSTDEEDNDTESEEEEEDEEEDALKADTESESTRASETVKAFEGDEAHEEEEDEGTDDDEEDWSWWSNDDDKLYYAMRTGSRTVFQKDKEVFNCYGRRSNRYLLLWYGFALDENRYNSARFKLWMNLKFPKAGGEAENLDVRKSLYDEEQETNQDGDPYYDPSEEEKDAITSPIDDSGEDMTLKSFVPHFKGLTQEFRLKATRSNDQLFTYFRSQLLYFYKGKDISNIFVSAPCSLEFEIQTLDYIESLLTVRLSNYLTTYEQDQELFKKETDHRRRFALIYRMGNKKILIEHQKMVKMIRYIINRIIAGKDLVSAYRELIPGIDSTEAEMITNRRKIRRYLYKLSLMNKLRMES